MAEIVDINGVKYARNEPEPQRHRYRMMASMMAMTAMYGGMDMMGGGRKERKRPAVDLAKEYALIQLKQSNLSRSDREWVVSAFESNYKKLDEAQAQTLMPDRVVVVRATVDGELETDNILVENGDMFDGTRSQFRDSFFDNADNFQIEDWCKTNEWTLSINGKVIL